MPRILGRRCCLGVAAALTALSLALVACRGRLGTGDTAPGGARLQLVVSPTPVPVGPVRLVATLTSPDGKPITGARLRVRADMAMAGMEPVIAKLTDVGTGHYVADRFQLSMGGDWILTISGQLPDGRAIRQTFVVRGVGARAASWIPAASG